MAPYGYAAAKEFADNNYPKFVNFIKRGNTYSVIREIGCLEKNEVWEILGLTWDGSRYQDEYGFRIETMSYRLCLPEDKYCDLFNDPQEYLVLTGTFDVKAFEKKLLDDVRKNGIGSKLP